MAFFKVSRYKALVDEAIRVKICNVPSSKATLVSKVEYAKKRYFAYSHYLVDNHSQSIDLETSPSVGGSYTGVEPMGFIWALKPEPNQRPGARLLVRDVNKPYTVRLEAYRDHLNADNLSNGQKLCETEIHRTYLSEHVEKVPVRHGRLRGNLFIPKNVESAPPVIDLFGMGGGNMEFRAALLASKGFVTFHVAFFNYEDLPKQYTIQDMTYFEEAVDFLLSHPKVSGNQVGVVGTSKGGEIASLMACFFPEKVKAVVVINTISFPTTPDIVYKDIRLTRSKLTPKPSEFIQCQKGLIGGPAYLGAPIEAVYPMERATANFLLISCEDDYSVPLDTPDKLAERLRMGGNNNYEIVNFPGAGHLLEPPYSPLCDVAYVELFGLVYYGGVPHAHHIAQIKFWNKLQDFMRTHLGEIKLKQKL